VLPAIHQCLPLPCKRSPDGASPDRLRISICSLLLIHLPQKDERLSRPGWLTYSRRFTHISGHPSAAGQRRTGKVRRSKTDVLPTVPRNQCAGMTFVYPFRPRNRSSRATRSIQDNCRSTRSIDSTFDPSLDSTRLWSTALDLIDFLLTV